MIESFEELERQCKECTRCPLAATRTNVVFGVGNQEAEVLFVGEGPGKNEDEQGEPFVGRAGQLLDKFLAAVGLSRESVYIANIVKCRSSRKPGPQAGGAGAVHRLAAQPILLNEAEDCGLLRAHCRSEDDQSQF